jgi:hypothetical protein
MSENKIKESEEIERLNLDKETSHGGWPNGKNRSFRSKKSVRQQILKFFKDMRLIEKIEHTYRIRDIKKSIKYLIYEWRQDGNK